MTSANALSKSTNFPRILAQEMFSKVKGHSSLAVLSAQEPIPFSGKDVFTFSLGNEVSIVAENGAKPEGAASISPVKMEPIKVVYQERVSDEFIRCSEERQIDYLRAFSEGFAKKIARGIDIMAIHGVDPQSKQASELIGTNCFDSAISGAKIIAYDDDNPDKCIDEAIAVVEGYEYDCTGIAMAPAVRSDIADLRNTGGGRTYPEFAFGGKPKSMGALTLDINNTVSYNSSDMRAIVGDFEDAFRWGICEQITLEVIEYGDPDGQGTDLKNHNQVLLRSEAYVGWAIMDANAFSSVEEADTP